MIAPAGLILALSREDLLALVRDAVRQAIAQLPSPTTTALVDRHELARLFDVSPATIARMTSDGMPHLFVGTSPRYAPEEVRAWLSERGRKGTKATPSKRETIAGVRLLSRVRQS